METGQVGHLGQSLTVSVVKTAVAMHVGQEPGVDLAPHLHQCMEEMIVLVIALKRVTVIKVMENCSSGI